MNLRIAMLAAVWIGAASLAGAQQTTPSAQPEAPTTPSSHPGAAASPHQRQAMGKEDSKAMKDCITKERAENSGMSKSAAKKACTEQLKSSSEPTNR